MKKLIIIPLALFSLSLSLAFTKLQTEHDHLYRIIVDEKIGFMNREGEVVIEPVFQMADHFYEGLAAARKDGLYGYIDKKGTYVIKPQFEFAEAFSDGIAKVYMNSKPVYINRKGKIQEIEEPEEEKSWYDRAAHRALDSLKDAFSADAFLGIPKKNVIDIQDNHFIFYEEIDTYEYHYGVAILNKHIIFPATLDRVDPSGFVHDLLSCSVNGNLTYLDKDGNIVWQEKESTGSELLNIDFMQNGYFFAFSEGHETDLGGFGGASNAPKKVKKALGFPKGMLSLVVDTLSEVSLYGRFKGYNVYIANTQSKTAVRFDAQDSRLYMNVQAIDEDGIWKDIEFLPSSWCGNSYHILTLEANRFWEFITPLYDGSIPTRLRIKLSVRRGEGNSVQGESYHIYSNEYIGSVNPAQFWRKRGYSPASIMNPY